MNIFVLDEDPVKAANDLCIEHLRKMPTESAQMLSTVIRGRIGSQGIIKKLDGTVKEYGYVLPNEYEQKIYLRTHYNHPCTLWTGKSKENAQWLLDHWKAMLNRFYKIRNKHHKTSNYYKTIESYVKELHFSNVELTPFVQCMPDEYKDFNPVTAYRNFYLYDKVRFATWKDSKPKWWIYDYVA